MDLAEMLSKEQELLNIIEETKDMIKTLQSHFIKLDDILFNERQKIADEIINTYKQAIKEKENKYPTYNITINTHGCDTKSPEELTKQIIEGIKKAGMSF
jgi:uncharacterized protein YydD (DUF2326 family)